MESLYNNRTLNCLFFRLWALLTLHSRGLLKLPWRVCRCENLLSRNQQELVVISCFLNLLFLLLLASLLEHYKLLSLRSEMLLKRVERKADSDLVLWVFTCILMTRWAFMSRYSHLLRASYGTGPIYSPSCHSCRRHAIHAWELTWGRNFGCIKQGYYRIVISLLYDAQVSI